MSLSHRCQYLRAQHCYIGAGAPGKVYVAVLGVVDLDKLPVAVGLVLNREVGT